jgi:hypothetical protein
MKTFNSAIAIILFVTIFGCTTQPDDVTSNNNGDTIDTIVEESETENEEPDDGESNVNPNPIGTSAGEVIFYNKELVDNNYILVNDAGNDYVYLMDKNATVKHQWNLKGGDLGNDCFLLQNGQLLTMVESEDPKILLGGSGGKTQLLDYDGNEDWSFVYSTEEYITHHDAEMLPSGNILTMTWTRYSKEDTQANGYELDVEVFLDGIIEINPTTNEIVWEWQALNHLVQEHDDSKANYGIVKENSQLIDFNYNQRDDGDLTHANGIAYDENKDVIYLSVNFYSEIWVIDHSTSIEEASSHTGGNYGKGGDLIYRFGNPSAYQNNNGDRLFNNNHYPNLLTDNRSMLVFSNGAELEQSTVYELQLPETFNLDINSNNEPFVAWSFTDSDLYSARVSGAVRLPNGNTLITEGDAGIWEVTQNGEIVWKFLGDGFYWRAYAYNKDAIEITNLNL